MTKEEILSQFTVKELRRELGRRAMASASQPTPPKKESEFIELKGRVVQGGKFAASYTNYRVVVTEAPEKIMQSLYQYERNEGIVVYLQVSGTGFKADNAPEVGDIVLMKFRKTKKWELWWRNRIKIYKILDE